MNASVRRNHRVVVVLIASMLLAAACTPTPPTTHPPVMGMFLRNEDGYADISVHQLAELIESREITLVNVHIPYEGEIPQTDLFIPYDEISNHLDELPAPDGPIVLYCRSGSMSTSAAEVLSALGYVNVAELDGGMRAWETAGYELRNH